MYVMLAPLDRAHPMAATRDIGAVIDGTLLDLAHDRRGIELEGHRRYAPHDVAEPLAKILDRPAAAAILPQ